MAALSQREIREGILEAQKKKRGALRIEIDSLVSSIEYQFDPRDEAMTYVDRINVDKLEVYLSSLKKKEAVLAGINAEIKRLEQELFGGDR